jgi:hypothetical protein
MNTSNILIIISIPTEEIKREKYYTVFFFILRRRETKIDMPLPYDVCMSKLLMRNCYWVLQPLNNENLMFQENKSTSHLP